MEFGFNEAQRAVTDAATAIFEGQADADRVGRVEATDERFDRQLWSDLARADLLGLAVPTEFDGGGLGVTELCLLLEAQGRQVAPVPLWSTLFLGALPVSRYGSEAQRRELLPGVVAGDVVLTAALSTVAASRSGRPGVHARPEGGGWRLEGQVPTVPQAHVAHRVLVPARTTSGEDIVALIDPSGDGCTLERAVTTNREIHPHLVLRDLEVSDAALLAGPDRGAEAISDMLLWAKTGLCVLQLGVTTEALTRTAAYLNQRQQFGRALSTFQATMLRAADAFIDIEAMRVTLWQAAWRLDSDREATDAVAVAHWQASEKGQRVVHATQHLHGGIGADITYPIHRYFLWAKQIELMLGGPSSELARIGRSLAVEAGRRAASAGTGSA